MSQPVKVRQLTFQEAQHAYIEALKELGYAHKGITKPAIELAAECSRQTILAFCRVNNLEIEE